MHLIKKLQYDSYKLPSEAIWEYAARGGNQSEGYIYAGSNTLKEVGWYNKNSHNETKPVGLKLPNELGLYDMSGNVDEWCADNWSENLKNIPKDGRPYEEKGNELAWFVAGLGSTMASSVVLPSASGSSSDGRDLRRHRVSFGPVLTLLHSDSCAFTLKYP
jgi:formylglycine-generating enzyme required for sulfatase activity